MPQSNSRISRARWLQLFAGGLRSVVVSAGCRLCPGQLWEVFATLPEGLAADAVVSLSSAPASTRVASGGLPYRPVLPEGERLWQRKHLLHFEECWEPDVALLSSERAAGLTICESCS